MKRQMVALLTLVFLISQSLNANAAVQPGNSCRKLGQTSILAGKKYTCIKSGMKLVWGKGVILKNPSQTSTSKKRPETPEGLAYQQIQLS